MREKSPDNERFAQAILRGLVSDWTTKGKCWPQFTLDHPLILGDSEANARRLLTEDEMKRHLAMVL